MTRPPSTTAAGLLGLLSLQSWSSYDLTAQVRRSLRYVLPRAESALYAEQRRLAEQGWASVTAETTGRRGRRVYRLTALGRRALRDWLATPPSEPQVEIEPLLRLLFADSGDKDELLAALDVLETWARQRLDEGRVICADYLAGDAPFPGRLHLSALFADYYAGLYRHTLDWVERARAEIDTWPSTSDVGLTPGTTVLLERIVAEADRAS